MTGVKRLRLAIASEEFTDAEVKRLFLDCEVESMTDIETIIGSLERNRPEVVRQLEEQFRSAAAYQQTKRQLVP